jgi:MFS transporter, DHA1 family, tetracycline resistance protein
MGIDYIVMALAPGLSWLFAGRLISGITSASMTTANAYVSDVTAPEDRSGAYGLMSSAFGVGLIAGPALGGWLGGWDHPRAPFWFAAICSLVNALYGFLVLPESLPPERRQRRLIWKMANPMGALKLLRSHPELLGLSGVTFVQNLAHEVYPTVFVLYAMNRYGWDQKMIGLALAVVGLSSIAISSLVGPAVKRLGEYPALFTGLLCGAFGFILFGWAASGFMFLLAIPLNSVWDLADPPVQTLMTKRVPASEQGKLQGAIGCLRSIAMLAGPGIFSATYAVFVSPGHAAPSAPWYLAAVMLAGAMLLAGVIMPKP